MLRQSGCWPSRALHTYPTLIKATTLQQIRRLTLHEHQAYQLLRQYNVPVPKGNLAQTVSDVKDHVKSLGGSAILKAQVFKGDRLHGIFDNGLKGGVQDVANASEAEEISSKMLGHCLRDAQAANGGPVVKQLYVTEHIDLKEKWYVAITVDRERYCPVLVISKKRGEHIDAAIPESPGDVFTFPLAYDSGFTEDVLSSIKQRLDISSKTFQSLKSTLQPLWAIFNEKDATLLELNPLGLLPSDTFLPLDAKFTFDDAAAPRQPELFAMRDVEQEVTQEVEAEKYGLVYIRMDGNIGNVVNGAGLAMATNDAIGLHGGSSANFLDAGGQATKETMIQAFRIILADERVKTILVNIYGGITKCDMIARSIIGAASELGPMRIPIVARLQGTNSAEGLRLLEEANLGIYVEAGFGEAAKKAVDLAAAS